MTGGAESGEAQVAWGQDLASSGEPWRVRSDMTGGAESGEAQVAWGVERIRAPSVWADWGVRGAGIVVANLDTGVYVTHTALLEQYRGWSPGGLSHDYNWYDAAGEPALPAPVDGAGHGTHTMGTMVGGAAGDYSSLGVAPGAQWMAVRGCQGVFCSDEALIRGAQWLLAPTNLAGTNPRPDLRPHIINNSWGKLGEDEWYLGYVTAWNAAGIFSVFAAGNSGALNGCESTTSPGNYAASLAVGATDTQDAIADFSSRGPAADGLLKPDLSAPGVGVPSTWPDGGVKTQNGTSMAAPHVAGVAALLWSANPTLIGDLAATRAALTGSALPRPTAECGEGGLVSPNNVYGWGRVDARSAVEAVRVDVPWLSAPASASLPADGIGLVEITLDARQVSAPGLYEARLLVMRAGEMTHIPIQFEVLDTPGTAPLTGALIDTWHGQPVYGRVRIGGGPEVQTDYAGHFTATLPTGPYMLNAEATGYLSATENVLLVDPSAVTIALTADLPHLITSSPALSATLAFAEQVSVPFTISNAGTQPLSLTAGVAPLEWIVEAAGEPAGGLYDLSAFEALSLTDDMIYPEPLSLGFDLPINGAVVSKVYLSSNGFVSGALPGSAAPFASCLPNGSVPPLTLAPFWTDLDPSQGGAVRAGQVDGDTFVVSFEAVPPWLETPVADPPTYTFQLAMHASGQVEYLYGAMAAPPFRWSMGMGHDGTRGQSLACYKAPVELAGRMWRMHNQPLPTLWLGVEPVEQWVMPSETVTLTATLSGYGYAAWHPDPFVGPLVLISNDPSQPAVVITATASIGPAPYVMFYPVVGK